MEEVAGDGVQGCKRLVHQQDIRILGQRARQGDTLLHATGQLVGPPLLKACKVDSIQKLASDGPALRGSHPAQLERQLDVSGCGQPGQQRRFLEHQRNASVHVRAPGGGAIESRENVEKRALSRT